MTLGANHRHCHISILKVSTTVEIILNHSVFIAAGICPIYEGSREVTASAGFIDQQADCSRKFPSFLDCPMRQSGNLLQQQKIYVNTFVRLSKSKILRLLTNRISLKSYVK